MFVVHFNVYDLNFTVSFLILIFFIMKVCIITHLQVTWKIRTMLHIVPLHITIIFKYIN